jgi:hypothetical protein
MNQNPPDNATARSVGQQQACSPLPPIRTVEAFRASAAEWNAAMQFSTSSDDADEVRRANAVCIREEQRWDECRHLFAFDDEGELVGLANTNYPEQLSGE